MTVLDIGAHHGYYTLLASQIVGPAGKVLAFEPSPRERKKLNLHLRLNRCKNVLIESCALGDADSAGQLFLASRTESGCNSLRRPDVSGAPAPISVVVQRLDQVLLKQRIGSVDFVKLDVEGAELSVLKGATELLTKRPRPSSLRRCRIFVRLHGDMRRKKSYDSSVISIIGGMRLWSAGTSRKWMSGWRSMMATSSRFPRSALPLRGIAFRRVKNQPQSRPGPSSMAADSSTVERRVRRES